MAENTYKPTDGMASAARRALKWKEEGRRGGTRVGLARANQLANNEALSASTVLRMYSFFSRHEVDKKATGFSSGEEGFPSPGRVAWDLWGGDAGASWSKQKRDQIMNDRMNKSVWSGVFFPADEPALVDIAEENDAPLDEPIVEEAAVEPTSAPVAEAPAPVVQEAVVEETQEPEEPVAEVSEPESVKEIVEEIAPAAEEAVVEEAVVEEVVEAAEEAPETEVAPETSAE
jgi:hypothetical protein